MSSATPPPCGLTVTQGVPMVAQAVLHRELLRVHASLAHIAHINTLLRQPLALRSPPLLDRVPHLRAQLQGLDHTLLIALRVDHTAIHYTHELLTAMGLRRVLRHSPEQLEAELQGRTTFADRLPLSTSPTIATVDGVAVFEGRPHYTFPSSDSPIHSTSTSPSITRTNSTSVRAPSAGPTPRSDLPPTLVVARSRSRSRPRSTPS